MGWRQILQGPVNVDELVQQLNLSRPLLPVGGAGNLIEIVADAGNRGQQLRVGHGRRLAPGSNAPTGT